MSYSLYISRSQYRSQSTSGPRWPLRDARDTRHAMPKARRFMPLDAALKALPATTHARYSYRHTSQAGILCHKIAMIDTHEQMRSMPFHCCRKHRPRWWFLYRATFAYIAFSIFHISHLRQPFSLLYYQIFNIARIFSKMIS